MEKSKKELLVNKVCFIVNLIYGVATVIALTLSYAFIFEADNKDTDVGLGLFILLIWLIILSATNIIFMLIGKFKAKDMAIFQLFPLLLGAISYSAFQLFIY